MLRKLSHARAIQTVGVFPQQLSVDSQQMAQKCRLGCRQLSNGADPPPIEFFTGGAAHIEQILHRQRPDQMAKVFPGKDCGGVRFSIVAAEFRKCLIETDANRRGQSHFFPNPAPNLLCNHAAVSEETDTARHIQPALVCAERLYLIRVFIVQLLYLL